LFKNLKFSQVKHGQIPLKPAKCYAFCETCQDFSPDKSNERAALTWREFSITAKIPLEKHGGANI
jgi:hypothetical protein